MNKEVLGASAEDPEDVAWYAITDLYLINPFARETPSCDEQIRLQILEQAPRAAPTSGSEEGGAGERDGCRPSVGQSASAFGGMRVGDVVPAPRQRSGKKGLHPLADGDMVFVG